MLIAIHIQRALRTRASHQDMRGDRMGDGYRQQPNASRVDGKRRAGKMTFAPPGSGGARPGMAPRDLSKIPESVGGDEPQPAGHHIHDRLRTGTTVGDRVPLVDGNAKVTGQAWYGDDVRLQNECIGKILRSPHHYARIRSIDTSAAEAMAGVLAVSTGEDAPDPFGVLPVTKDEHAMAVEKVRHVGDLVACVATVDEPTAIEALRAIVVDYEVIDAVHDIRKGLEDVDDPIHWRGKYHVGSTNVQKRGTRSSATVPSSADDDRESWAMDVRWCEPWIHRTPCGCRALGPEWAPPTLHPSAGPTLRPPCVGVGAGGSDASDQRHPHLRRRWIWWEIRSLPTRDVPLRSSLGRRGDRSASPSIERRSSGSIVADIRARSKSR